MLSSVNLKTSVLVAIRESSCTGKNVWVATDWKLIGANSGIDELWCGNDGFAVVAGESVITIVGNSAPFGDVVVGLLLLSPNTRSVYAKCLMWCSWIPCTWTGNCLAFTETTFSQRFQIPRLTWSTIPRVTIISSRWISTIIRSWTIWIAIFAQTADRFNPGWASWIAWCARMSWQIQVTWLEIIAAALVRITFWRIRFIAFWWKIVQALLDVWRATVAIIVGASVKDCQLVCANLSHSMLVLPAHWRSFKSWWRWNLKSSAITGWSLSVTIPVIIIPVIW